MIGSDRSNNLSFGLLRGAAARCLLVAVPLGIAPAVVLTSAVPAHAGSYTFQDIIDPLNPTFTQALGINGSGTIAGYGNATTFNGFTLALPSSFTRLNVPGADGGTQVTGIDAAGDTVGFSITGGVTNGFAHLAGGSTFTTVDDPGFAFTQVLGISSNGATAAGYWTHDVTGLTGQLAGFVTGGPGFASPTFTGINGLLPANTNSQATGVNDTGEVVGFYQEGPNTSPLFHGFTDIGGSITPFLVPGSVSTQALGVNDLGEIVGDYVTGGVMHGFLDNAGTFTTLDPTGSTATTINGINDSGTVVGFYVNANGATIGTEGTMVPEPSTWAMMLAGFAGLGFLGYRKVRQGKLAA
jgi:hypothetical protein